MPPAPTQDGDFSVPPPPAPRRRPSAVTGMCLSVLLGVPAAAGLWASVRFNDVSYPALRAAYTWLADTYEPSRVPPVLAALSVAGAVCSALALLAAAAGLVRKGWALWALRKGYLAAYALAVFWAYVVLEVTGRIEAGEIDFPAPPDPVTVFIWRCEGLLPAAALAIFVAVCHVVSWRRAVVNYYTRSDEPAPAPGDEIVENVRTHGRDPGFRKSVIGSVALHLLVIVVIPLLMRLRGCVEPYRIPLGSGSPAVAMVKVVNKQKKPKRKKYILSVGSAIIFEPPDLDDSNLMKDVDEETHVRYKASARATAGAMGTGGGDTPGWADGFADGVVRFIRLEYNGQDWDDGMSPRGKGDAGADMNFLTEFRRLAGGIKIAKRSESHPISYLRKYPKGQAPPFVYMTGSRRIHVSDSDVKVLREYIKEGGMLFADCGSREWDRSFRAFARRLFPGNPLREIADDDPIFQIPFTFVNGPPPLWHHGGYKAMGIKYKRRWGVFYFPGDLNDAWKLKHSGLAPELARGAFQLGSNIVYYSFTRYLQATRKYRK